MVEIEKIIQQIENETQVGGNTKGRVASVLRKLKEKITFVSEEIGELKIGGRNLFKGKIHLSGSDYFKSDNSKEGVIKIQHTDTKWNAYSWIIPTQEVVGKPLSMGIYFKAPMGVNFDIDFYADHYKNSKRKNFVGNGEWQWLKIENVTKTDASKGILVGIYGSSPIIANVEYKDFILVTGTKAPENWIPAPEDIFSEITTRQLSLSQSVATSTLINGFSQNGRTMVSTGTNEIVVTIDSPDGFSASYQKGGLGNITFVPESGKLLIQVDGANVIDGDKGSTATISVVGDEILLRISNV